MTSLSLDSHHSAARREEIERVAEALANPGDLDGVINAFDAGETRVTDISRLTIRERDAILNSGIPSSHEDATVLSPLYGGGILVTGTSGLRAALGGTISEPDEGKQAQFFDEVQGFINEGHSWATHLDNQFAKTNGVNLAEARQMRGLKKDNGESAPELVLKFLDEYKNNPTIGYYLAGRSLALELQTAEQQRDALLAAKQKVAAQIRRLGPQTGLREVHQERTLAQVDRITFGGQDRLDIRRNWRGEAVAKYRGASLRIILVGDSSRTLPKDLLPHELSHGSSAQESTKQIGRIGLSVSRDSLGFSSDGDDAEEGMAEFLGLDAAGKRPRRSIGKIHFGNRSNAGYYNLFVSGMQRISRDDFATLYRARHGQVDSKDALLGALSAFHANLKP